MTAEEFVKSRFQNSDRADFESNKRNVIEFAKLHVEAALKEASENAYFITRDHDMYNREYLKYIDIDSNDVEGDTFCYGGSIIINKESILNAYPLDSIK